MLEMNLDIDLDECPVIELVRWISKLVKTSIVHLILSNSCLCVGFILYQGQTDLQAGQISVHVQGYVLVQCQATSL